MSGPSVIPLQKAIYVALMADATLMNMISGIYDHVPQSSNFPYVVFGNSQSRAWDNREDSGMDLQVVLDIYSRTAGRKEAGDISERLYTLLHHGQLTLDGQSLILLRFMNSKVELDDDGLTYRASLQFRALVQSN